MEAKRPQASWGFWFGWVAANSFAVPLGSIAAFVVLVAAGLVKLCLFTCQPSPELGTLQAKVMIALIAGAVLGVIIGAAQWLIVRRKIGANSLLWVGATAIGCLVSNGSFELLVQLAPINVAISFGRWAACGAGIGAAQWLMMQRQFSWSGWWVAANIVAGGLVGLAVSTANAVLLVIALILSGTITSAMLVWLLRQPRADQPKSSSEATYGS